MSYIYELDPAKFISASGLGWQSSGIDMLLVEKGISHVYVRNMSLSLRYAKENNKYMDDYDKNKELSYIKY